MVCKCTTLCEEKLWKKIGDKVSILYYANSILRKASRKCVYEFLLSTELEMVQKEYWFSCKKKCVIKVSLNERQTCSDEWPVKKKYDWFLIFQEVCIFVTLHQILSLLRDATYEQLRVLCWR